MEEKGFFRSLFDFSFSQFVTPKIVKFLYGLGILGAFILTLYMAVPLVIASARESVAAVFLVLLLSPLFFLMYIIYIRVLLEIFVALFRMAEFTRETRDILRETRETQRGTS